MYRRFLKSGDWNMIRRLGFTIGLMVATGMSIQVSEADTELHAGPYLKKADINIGGYMFDAPIGGEDAAPIVRVTHEDGVYSSYDVGQGLRFSVDYNATCGRGHTLSGLSFAMRDHDGNSLDVFESTVPSPDTDLSRKAFLMTEYAPIDPDNLTAHSPITACNQVIQTRKVEGKPVLALLRKGFWRELTPAYETRMSYRCQKDGLGFNDITSHGESADQPVFVHCVGDPDYQRNVAQTSTNTSASSASRSDIGDALDEKAKKREAFIATFRMRTVLEEGAKVQRITTPLPLTAFKSLKQKLQQEDGLRLVDFEIVKSDNVPYYIGLWEEGVGATPIKAPKKIIEFNTLHNNQIDEGFVIIDFEVVRIEGELHYASLWAKDRGVQDVRGAPRLPFGDRSAFMDLYNSQKADNWFPVDLEIIERDGKIAYRAVWQKFPDGDGPQFMSAVPLEEFRTLRDQLNAAGKVVSDLERIEISGETMVAGLWIDGDGATAFTRPRSYDDMANFMEGPLGNRHIRDLEVYITD
ncbi:MAG: hypothetical protein AAF719_04755 [Pseudomonadota bacterium]